MAESNLRSLLATARGTGQRPDAAVGDSEMEAILGVLKGGEAAAEGAEETPSETAPEPVAEEHTVDPATSQG